MMVGKGFSQKSKSVSQLSIEIWEAIDEEKIAYCKLINEMISESIDQGEQQRASMNISMISTKIYNMFLRDQVIHPIIIVHTEFFISETCRINLTK